MCSLDAGVWEGESLKLAYDPDICRLLEDSLPGCARLRLAENPGRGSVVHAGPAVAAATAAFSYVSVVRTMNVQGLSVFGLFSSGGDTWLSSISFRLP